MKLNKIFAAFMLIAAMAFAACEGPDINIDGPGPKPDDTTTVVVGGAPDTIGWNIPAECLTVAQAREICAKLESGATTSTKYYVKGWVKKLANKHADGISQYNNALFYMEDVKDANSQEDFYAYQVYGLDGAKITHPEAVAVGDYVVVFGELTNYNGTYETVGKGAAHIWKSTNTNLSGSSSGNPPSGEVTGAGTLENPYTAADILSLNNTETGEYWVKAYIVGQVNGVSMSSNSEFNAPFSGSSNDDGSVNAYNTNLLVAMSADVADATQCVPVQLPNGALRSGLNLAQNPDMDGKEILLYGSLQAYFGAAGVKGTSYAKVGDKEFGVKPGETQEEPTAKVVTIAEFNDAPESPEVYYELTGTIGGTINTTYGNFDLTDETGTVYVYGLTKEFIAVGTTQNDKSFASLGLKEGDKITLRGFRGSYNGKIEVMGAYFVKLVSSGNGDNNGNGNGNDSTSTIDPEGAIVFDADVENEGIGTDSNNATSYTITKNGITINVTQGIVGTYNGEKHYRIYKNQTLTITSTVGNITGVEFTCTANGDAQYGPGGFTVSTGEYGHTGGAVGTWTGSASEIVFTASVNQVRASQIVVTTESATNE